MKKIILLLTLCFTVVCGMWGQGEASNTNNPNASNMPEFTKHPKKYAEEHYPNELDGWIYYWAQNNEFALSRKDAKRFAQNQFKLEFREAIDGVFDGDFGGGELLQEAHRNIGQKSIEELVGTWRTKIRSSKFSKYEYLEYEFQVWNDNGEDGYTCFIYGRVPRDVIYGSLEKALDKAIETTDKNGLSVFGDIKDEIYDYFDIENIIEDAEATFDN